jgi:tripeptide aminopeptidase
MARKFGVAAVVWLFLFAMLSSQADTKPETLPPQQEVARVAALPAVHAAFQWFQSHEREISERQLEMVKIPSPPFGEAMRSRWLRERFRDAGLHDVHSDELGNVFGVRRGSDSSAKYVAITAHIDTVFPAGTQLDVRRDGDKLLGPGISDNGAGVMALLAVAQAMHSAEVHNVAPIVFIGNVGEEGEGDLRGMRRVFSDPKWKDAIAATLVIDGASSDTIVAQALGSRRFEVTVRGPGGHSWSDFGAPNPIVLLSRAIAHMSLIPLPASPKTTLNVGVISGGTSVNSIPESASARVDMRSSSTEQLERVEAAMRQAVARALANGNGVAGVSYEIKQIGERPAGELAETSRMLAVMRAVDVHLGNASRVTRASTDANVPISQGREALALGGGGSGGGAHTVHEWFDPRGRDLGLKRILLALLATAGVK